MLAASSVPPITLAAPAPGRAGAAIIAASLGSKVVPLAVVAVSTAAIYLFLTAMLRIFGRRQLGQLTVIDVVVVLLLGSSVETAMIHGDVTLPAGLVCAATLLVVNKTLTRLAFRRPRLMKLVDGEPVLLVNDGRPVPEHLRRAGMTERDLAQALRTHGYSHASELRYATLEPDGSVSMIPRDAKAPDEQPPEAPTGPPEAPTGPPEAPTGPPGSGGGQRD